MLGNICWSCIFSGLNWLSNIWWARFFSTETGLGVKENLPLFFALVSNTCSNSVFHVFAVMATIPDGHKGTCKGKGLQQIGYHGYIKVDESDELQELFCSCCQLQCPSCQVWGRNVIRGIGHTLPPKKSPPAFKGPPPKKNLVFKDDPSSFLAQYFLACKTHIRCFPSHIFQAAMKQLANNRKKQDYIID